MITRADEIDYVPGWDGLSEHKNSIGKVRNLDSKMDFKEHQRIVFQALQQLLGGNMNLGGNLRFTKAGEALEALKEAYDQPSCYDTVLKIKKGIHQPYSNPHIQLLLEHNDEEYEYHLNVAVSDDRIRGLPEEYFHWVGIQFTAAIGGVVVCWPLNARPNPKVHSRRRMSIAPDAVKGVIEKLAADAKQ
jgi:hypothetical protein